MTRPLRRDKDVKNASLIAGLRMEPALALALTSRALAGTRDKQGRANVAAVARYLLRRGLGASLEQAAQDVLCPSTAIPGLRVEHELVLRLDIVSGKLGLNRAATVRHLLRLQLGVSAEASLETEARFTQIATARRAIMAVQ